MRIVRYTQEKASEWDEFTKGSKNGTFLFLRGYMDYHSDRFKDHSLMYYTDRGKLLAVLPANERLDMGTLYSHQGLTYGGFVLTPKAHISEVGELFEATLNYLRENGFSRWYYKQIPTAYHRIPSEEDTYWLWKHNATITDCNMMTAIDIKNDMSVVSSRKKTYSNRLLRQGYTVDMSAQVEDFWPILEDNLMERFCVKPVHSLEEIQLLHGRFPHNIICCTVKDPEDLVIAGTLLFITDQVVRTQYISASHKGKHVNALDFLMLTLEDHYSKQPGHRYFEFGTSMAEDGINLNEGLILQKEEFGGRSIACRTYSIEV